MANRPFPLRFLNDSFPETLTGALFLLYIAAGLGLLTGGLNSTGGALLIVGRVAAALAMVQNRRWGYSLAIGIAVARIVPYVLSWIYYRSIDGAGLGFDDSGILDLFFAGLFLALWMHQRSREYQRLWFH